MDKALLVTPEIGAGSEIIQALDEAGMKVNVALWAVLSEYEDWRLVLSSSSFDGANPLKAYEAVGDVLRKRGIRTYQLPFMILRMKDPLISGLRKVFAKTRSVEGMRLGGQSFGDRFLEDAYVYRIK
ncbi:MAG: hypothetical protein ACYCSN_15670 [Acidobacteriaceae bacterium]